MESGLDKRKSGIRCAVDNCDSSKRKNIRLFKLNKCNKKYNEWIKNCNVKNVNLKNIKVCEKHFEKKYFTKTGLRRNAVPTKNLEDMPGPAGNTTDNLQDDFDAFSDDNVSMITILSVDNISEIDEACYSDSDMCTRFSGRNYGLSSTSENDKENIESDISVFEEPPHYSKVEFDPAKCENCLRNIKNENYYRLKFYESLRIINLKDK